jgi:hypothetical protein
MKDPRGTFYPLYRIQFQFADQKHELLWSHSCLPLSLQEIDDTPEAYIRYTPQRENFWCEVAQKSIESTGVQKVIKVSSQQLVGLLIIAYVDESIAQDISDVSSTYLGTGTLGMGNKGATAVRLKYIVPFLVWVC